MKKRFFTLLLVLFFCFALAVPVFAADSSLAPLDNAVVCPYCGEKFLTHYVDIELGGVSHEEWKCWNCGNYYEKDSIGNFVLSEKGNGTLLQFVDKGISATMNQSGNTVVPAVTSDGQLILYGKHAASQVGSSSKIAVCSHFARGQSSSALTASFVCDDVHPSVTWSANDSAGIPNVSYRFLQKFVCPVNGYYTLNKAYSFSGTEYDTNNHARVLRINSSSVGYGNVDTAGLYSIGTTSDIPVKKYYAAGSVLYFGSNIGSETSNTASGSVSVDFSDFYLSYVPAVSAPVAVTNNFTYNNTSVTVNAGETVYNYGGNYYDFHSDGSKTIYYTDVELGAGLTLDIDASGNVTVTPNGNYPSPTPVPTATPAPTASPTPTATPVPDGGGGSGGGLFSGVFDSILGGLLSALKSVLGLIIKLLFGLLKWITTFLFFVNSQYLGGFIPAPIWAVVAIAVPLVVVLGVVRFIRGFF